VLTIPYCRSAAMRSSPLCSGTSRDTPYKGVYRVPPWTQVRSLSLVLARTKTFPRFEYRYRDGNVDGLS
jgi:hypothetical protein